jgi:hypothetical protein
MITVSPRITIGIIFHYTSLPYSNQTEGPRVEGVRFDEGGSMNRRC